MSLDLFNHHPANAARPHVLVIFPQGPDPSPTPTHMRLHGFTQAQALHQLRHEVLAHARVCWAQAVPGLGLALIGETDCSTRVVAVIAEGFTEAELNTELRRQLLAESVQLAVAEAEGRPQ